MWQALQVEMSKVPQRLSAGLPAALFVSDTFNVGARACVVLTSQLARLDAAGAMQALTAVALLVVLRAPRAAATLLAGVAVQTYACPTPLLPAARVASLVAAVMLPAALSWRRRCREASVRADTATSMAALLAEVTALRADVAAASRALHDLRSTVSDLRANVNIMRVDMHQAAPPRRPGVSASRRVSERGPQMGARTAFAGP
jgi:hypothetical protein